MILNKVKPQNSIYLIAFLFNVGVALTFILIPLFGLSLGYNAARIGILLSIPGIAQIVLRVFAGAFSDDLGEKIMLSLTFSGLVVAGIIFSFSKGFWGLAVAQFFMGISRSIYWPASQSYASRITDDETSKILGKLTGFVYMGQLLGFASAGWIIMNYGYIKTFNIISFVGMSGLMVIFFLTPPIPLSMEKRKIHLIKVIPEMLKALPVQLAILNAFLAGVAYSIASSFFPVWLKGAGLTEGVVSTIFSFQLIGSIIAGSVFGVIHRKLNIPYLLQICLLGIGLSFLLVSAGSNLALNALIHLFFGFFAGFVTVSYQVIAVRNSIEANRGIILATVGLGWGFAFLVSPALFGWLIDSFTLKTAFSSLGVTIIILSLFVKVLFARLEDSVKAA